MEYKELSQILVNKKLKVTPQRIVVLDALMQLRNHPTAEEVKKYVRKTNPNLAFGTIYNTLEIFCKKGILKKVKTDRDFMRYDIELDSHHHLYCDECDYIENYYNEELDVILKEYFEKKGIKNFEIKDINLQIVGHYKNHKPVKE